MLIFNTFSPIWDRTLLSYQFHCGNFEIYIEVGKNKNQISSCNISRVIFFLKVPVRLEKSDWIFDCCHITIRACINVTWICGMFSVLCSCKFAVLILICWRHKMVFKSDRSKYQIEETAIKNNGTARWNDSFYPNGTFKFIYGNIPNQFDHSLFGVHWQYLHYIADDWTRYGEFFDWEEELDDLYLQFDFYTSYSCSRTMIRTQLCS